MKIKKDVYNQMIDWMKKNIPFEACGLLVGNGDTIDEFIPMNNIAKSETFFEMDPVELMNTLDKIDEKGKDFIAIFHSHPVTDPYPSKTDLDRNELIDHLIFVISSMKDGSPTVKAYNIKDKNVKEIGVTILDE
ncbi:MAG: M67 family metallopeptidase [Brevinematales bacterium]|nr:M67 family metallopeptidase [Brevinematales bacterium]